MPNCGVVNGSVAGRQQSMVRPKKIVLGLADLFEIGGYQVLQIDNISELTDETPYHLSLVFFAMDAH